MSGKSVNYKEMDHGVKEPVRISSFGREVTVTASFQTQKTSYKHLCFEKMVLPNHENSVNCAILRGHLFSLVIQSRTD